ncbi:hypothetical protein K505DRAFT_72545 [Melanomma pulvis-pyrius CBS 109.77]|uniref:Uncharacterized protein n=1 Tax=Melanomma pulvis-pyrius CBS 109.77 TaxID=1314802 RepID=A0A6A6X3S6_9PLEO|nr:hypothetical protein K505DRAFT_72545 [Melanomma pulvis-pyrius CBS 109.77]
MFQRHAGLALPLSSLEPEVSCARHRRPFSLMFVMESACVREMFLRRGSETWSSERGGASGTWLAGGFRGWAGCDARIRGTELDGCRRDA